MNAQSPYNQNEELVAMKQDIADRSYNIQVKKWMIGGLAIAGGVLLGTLALPLVPFLAAAKGVVGMGAIMGGALGFMAGGVAADMATMKDREKLKIDQSMVDSYMSGKNYWGEGYREEVAERGYSLSGPGMVGAAPPPRGRGRE
ncbi:MAG: hypothetical protein ACK502_07905 [Alphaproteobacteria bacterium]